MSTAPEAVAEGFLKTIPRLMRIVAADVRKSGHPVEPAYLRLLGMLSRRERSLGDLARMQSVRLPTMSRTISTLEERGWVDRRRSDEDRRVVLVGLTEEGRRVLSEAWSYVVGRITSLLESVPSEDLEIVSRAMEILGEVFSRALPAEASSPPPRETET